MNIFKRREERQRFSIKKYHFGAASVLIGAILFASTSHEASANEYDGKSTSEAINEATSSSEHTEATNNQVNTPTEENPTTEASEVTEKKIETSKENPTTEVTEAAEKEKETTKEENPTAEVTETTEKEKETSKENPITEETEATEKEKETSKENPTTEITEATDKKIDTSIKENPTNKEEQNSDDLNHESLDDETDYSAVRINSNAVTISDFKKLSPEAIKQLKEEDFKNFKMTPDLYNELSEEQIVALTLNKNYQTQARKGSPKKHFKIATENTENPPAEGYNITSNVPSNSDGLIYDVNKVTDPKHYTFEVVSKGDNGSKQYAMSVRKEDVDQEGTPVRFFITIFDEGRKSSTKEIDIANIEPGAQIKLDDLTILSVTMKGDKHSFRLLRADDTVEGNFKPIYGHNVDTITSPVTSYQLLIPFWKGQVTHYYDELGNEIAPSYTQYGWTKDKYTTEPPIINGYEIDNNRIPLNKNGTINKYSGKIEGNIRYSKSTTSRGTIYRKDTILDDKGTVRSEIWFTYAKAPKTFDPVNGTTIDRGRVAANNLPDETYDFITNPDGYEFRERIGSSQEEQNYERLGMEGKVVFQKFRFQKNGLPSKNAVSEDEYDSGDAASSTSVVLKKGEVTNSRYDGGRTFDISNKFEYPDEVKYYYITKKGNVVVNYVDEEGNTIKDPVEDTPNSKVDTEYDTTDNKPKVIEKDGKKYIFTRVKDGDKETGNVVEGTTTVTYIYKELGKYIPFIPENPGDGYDPNKPGTEEPPVPYDETPEEPGDNPPLPYIPGYTPKDPNGNPLVPVDPEDPTKGYVPPTITNPDDPSKDTPVPYEKDKPNKPENPDNPNNPDKPENPDNPDNPDNPNNPDKPNKPENPDNPNNPDKPNTPENPDNPNNPDKPNTPENPDNPNNPDTPNKPENPDNPNNPDKPNTPENPDNPNNPDKPNTPGNPDTPNMPGTSGALDKSGASSAPNVLKKDETSKAQGKENGVQQLPDTGETDNTGALSAILALLGGMFFATSRRKNKKKEQN